MVHGQTVVRDFAHDALQLWATVQTLLRAGARRTERAAGRLRRESGIEYGIGLLKFSLGMHECGIRLLKT